MHGCVKEGAVSAGRVDVEVDVVVAGRCGAGMKKNASPAAACPEGGV